MAPKNFLDQLLAFSDYSKEIIASIGTVRTKHFKKGEVIQSAGEQLQYAYYVKSGLLRSYVVDQNGKEHIFMFAPEGWVMTDIASSKINNPIYLTIDAIENTEVEVFNVQNFEDTVKVLSSKHDTFASTEINRLLKRISTLQKRIIMLMSFSAYERYEEFNAMYPGLSQRVSQKMIASYLGITPESLSKIKKKNFKK